MAEVIMLPRAARSQEEGVTVFPPVRTPLSSYLRTALMSLDAGLISEEDFRHVLTVRLARERRTDA
jgi:hypothetical protein